MMNSNSINALLLRLLVALAAIGNSLQDDDAGPAQSVMCSVCCFVLFLCFHIAPPSFPLHSLLDWLTYVVVLSIRFLSFWKRARTRSVHTLIVQLTTTVKRRHVRVTHLRMVVEMLPELTCVPMNRFTTRQLRYAIADTAAGGIMWTHRHCAVQSRVKPSGPRQTWSLPSRQDTNGGMVLLFQMDLTRIRGNAPQLLVVTSLFACWHLV